MWEQPIKNDNTEFRLRQESDNVDIFDIISARGAKGLGGRVVGDALRHPRNEPSSSPRAGKPGVTSVVLWTNGRFVIITLEGGTGEDAGKEECEAEESSVRQASDNTCILDLSSSVGRHKHGPKLFSSVARAGERGRRGARRGGNQRTMGCIVCRRTRGARARPQTRPRAGPARVRGPHAKAALGSGDSAVGTTSVPERRNSGIPPKKHRFCTACRANPNCGSRPVG